MTRYAWIGADPLTTTPIQVKAWLDTDMIRYPNMPSADELREMNDTDWNARDTKYYISTAGFMEPPPPPVVSLTPDQILAEKITQGIAITCTSNPSGLNATYALDSETMVQIGSVARDVGAGLGFPGGGSLFTYPDIAGQPHSFTEPQLMACYQAMRNLLWIMNTQVGIIKQGGTPEWPAQNATIP